MDKRKIAVVYDNITKPDSVGVYCRRALEDIAEVEHVLPAQLARLEPSTYQIFLRVYDHFEYSFPEELKPSAFWITDLYPKNDRHLFSVMSFDYVFAAQQITVNWLRNCGISDVQWLPLAADQWIHRIRLAGCKLHDVCIASESIETDHEFYLSLTRRFHAVTVNRATFEERSATYSQSRIVVASEAGGEIGRCVFEAMASRAMVLAHGDAESGLLNLFEEGVQLETYRTQDELFRKIRYYLEHEYEREKVASQGYQRVLECHTYSDRMRQLLATTAGRDLLKHD